MTVPAAGADEEEQSESWLLARASVGDPASRSGRALSDAVPVRSEPFVCVRDRSRVGAGVIGSAWKPA